MKMLTLAVVLMLAAAVQGQVKSVYTPLSDKACKELKSDVGEGIEYEGDCPGVGGYRLRFLESDLRQSIDVIAPDKKRFQLGFWYISPAFSHLGDKAEWRMKGRVPIALIVRFNSRQDPDDTKKIKSYLVVSKISSSESCVTDVVEPMAYQNAEARKLADVAASKTCKFPRE